MRPIRVVDGTDLDPTEECVQAKQMTQLLEELREELTGMSDYAGLLISLIERRYPQHRKLLKVLWGVRESQRHYLDRTFQILLDYRAKTFEIEHKYGHIESKPLPALTPIAVSFEELMSVSSTDEMWKEFLDG